MNIDIMPYISGYNTLVRIGNNMNGTLATAKLERV